MNRKLWVVLLVLTFMLGSLSGLWLKPAQANTGEERRVMLCVAEPWHGGEWNKVSAPGSNQNPTDSSADPARSGDRAGRQKVQHKPQGLLWSQVRFFLFNLRLLIGSK